MARALRPAARRRRRSWTRKAVGALTLRRANKTTFSATLRAPRRVGRRLVFRLANGVAVTWMRRSVAVSGLPEGTSGVWLRLDGTRRRRPYTNPARKATVKHGARLVARDQSAATVSRTLKISAR